MNINSNSLHILFVIVMFGLSSCKKDDKTYNGEPLISFSQPSYDISIHATQSNKKVIMLRLQINTKPLSTDKTIYFDIIDENKDLKNHLYSISENKIILSKDSMFAYIPISLLCDSINEGQSFTLNIKLNDKSEISPSANQSTCSILVKKLEFLNLFIGSYNCEEPVNQDSYQTTFAISDLKTLTIKNLNFWNFSGEGQFVVYKITKDSTRKIEILEQNWIDKAGNEYIVSGIGTYSLDGSMKVDYTISTSDSVYEQGTHSFTPLK